jgi:hypothetical protein
MSKKINGCCLFVLTMGLSAVLATVTFLIERLTPRPNILAKEVPLLTRISLLSGSSFCHAGKKTFRRNRSPLAQRLSAWPASTWTPEC